MEGTATRRALLGATIMLPALMAGGAAVAMTDCSKWERRLGRYHRARLADEGDSALRAALDRHYSECRAIARDFGCDPKDRNNPEARARFDVSFRLVTDAEQKHAEAFGFKRDKALTLLMLTPAPTVQALSSKMEIATAECLIDVQGVPLAEIVNRDLARLARGGSGQ